MKFIKFFKFDIRYGIIKQYYNYLFFSILIALAFFEFHSIQLSLENDKFTLMDSFLHIYGGVKESNGVFKLPYIWLLNHVLILFFNLNYMHKDLHGFGQNNIYRSGNRTQWWLSKCLCQFISILCYYLISWTELIILTLVCKGNISLTISKAMKAITDLGLYALPKPNWNLQTSLIVLPFLFTATAGMVQIALNLFLKPIYSYIAVAVVCILSAYYLNPFLMGNYAMAVRCDRLIANGVNPTVGIIALITVGLCAVIVGAYRFKRYDILT